MLVVEVLACFIRVTQTVTHGAYRNSVHTLAGAGIATAATGMAGMATVFGRLRRLPIKIPPSHSGPLSGHCAH